MPDLNSVPSSPHPLASRRASTSASTSTFQTAHQMAPQVASPPSASSSSLNILPSNQTTVSQPASLASQPSQLLQSSPSTQQATTTMPLSSSIDASVGSGPGPLRHPRPLTASELHMQLEKEQEAVVNRLTRELTLLRAAHNASVVSNTSSASATTSTHEPMAESSLLSGSGFSIPTTRRHHRTSSSTSQSQNIQLGSSYEGRSQQPRPPHSVSLSRQNSATSRRSLTGSPAPPSSLDPSNYFHQQRVPASSSAMAGSVIATAGSSNMGEQLSPGLMPATLRYEETAFYRSELEVAKKENDALKRRIRELERFVRDRRASDASRPRSDSVSTTASASVAPSGGVSIAGPRDAVSRPERERALTSQSTVSATGGMGIGVPEDEVGVGESAASGRLGSTNQA